MDRSEEVLKMRIVFLFIMTSFGTIGTIWGGPLGLESAFDFLSLRFAEVVVTNRSSIALRLSTGTLSEIREHTDELHGRYIGHDAGDWLVVAPWKTRQCVGSEYGFDMSVRSGSDYMQSGEVPDSFRDERTLLDVEVYEIGGGGRSNEVRRVVLAHYVVSLNMRLAYSCADGRVSEFPLPFPPPTSEEERYRRSCERTVSESQAFLRSRLEEAKRLWDQKHDVVVFADDGSCNRYGFSQAGVLEYCTLYTDSSLKTGPRFEIYGFDDRLNVTFRIYVNRGVVSRRVWTINGGHLVFEKRPEAILRLVKRALDGLGLDSQKTVSGFEDLAVQALFVKEGALVDSEDGE